MPDHRKTIRELPVTNRARGCHVACVQHDKEEVRVCVRLSDACGFVPQKLQHFYPSCASRCCGFPLGEKLSEQNCNILKAVVKFLHWVKKLSAQNCNVQSRYDGVALGKKTRNGIAISMAAVPTSQ